jgi:hypothetical protein
MAKVKSHLIQLIHSLTAEELRFVKQTIREQRRLDSGVYLELMDIFLSETAGEAADQSVKKKIRKGYLLKNLSQAKAILLELILQSLRKYFQQHSKFYAFYDRVAIIKILRQRGFYKLAGEQADKLLVSAPVHMKLPYRVLIADIDFERRLKNESVEQMKSFLDQQEEVIEFETKRFFAHRKMRLLNARMALFIQSTGRALTEIQIREVDQWFSEVKTLGKDLDKDTAFQIMCLQFMISYHFSKGNSSAYLENAILYSDHLYMVAAEQPEELRNAIIGQVNLMKAAEAEGSHRHTEGAYETYHQLRKLDERNLYRGLDDAVEDLMRYYWLSKGNFSRAEKSADQTLKEIAEKPHGRAPGRPLWHGLVTVYLVCCKYEKVDKVCRLIFREAKEVQADNVLVMLYIAQLIALFKMKEQTLLVSHYRSALRFLKNKGIDDEFVLLLCSYLYLNRKKSDSQRIRALEDLQRSTDWESDFDKSVLARFKVLRMWIQSELQQSDT